MINHRLKAEAINSIFVRGNEPLKHDYELTKVSKQYSDNKSSSKSKK